MTRDMLGSLLAEVPRDCAGCRKTAYVTAEERVRGRWTCYGCGLVNASALEPAGSVAPMPCPCGSGDVGTYHSCSGMLARSIVSSVHSGTYVTYLPRAWDPILAAMAKRKRKASKRLSDLARGRSVKAPAKIERGE